MDEYLRPAIEERKLSLPDCDDVDHDHEGDGTAAVVAITLDLPAIGVTAHVGNYCRACADIVIARLREGGCA